MFNISHNTNQKANILSASILEKADIHWSLNNQLLLLKTTKCYILSGPFMRPLRTNPFTKESGNFQFHKPGKTRKKKKKLKATIANKIKPNSEEPCYQRNHSCSNGGCTQRNCTVLHGWSWGNLAGILRCGSSAESSKTQKNHAVDDKGHDQPGTLHCSMVVNRQKRFELWIEENDSNRRVLSCRERKGLKVFKYELMGCGEESASSSLLA